MLFLALLPLAQASGKVSFSGLDLSGDDRLLFRADSDQNGVRPQGALFVSQLTDISTKQLTAFPERMDLIENGAALQIRSAFGAVRIPLSGGLPRNILGFPSFAAGAPALGGRVEGLAASGDGRWLLYVDPVTAAYGNLTLIDTVSGTRTLIAGNVERPDRIFPACWSPDSRIFVYCRGGKLYYHTVSAAAVQVDERYRLIGEGAINSVSWGAGGEFFYLRGSTVYRVRGTELFVRALYADFIEIGAVAGKIPWNFDPNFDAFWIGPDAKAILLSKGGRNLFYYPLGIDDYRGEYPGSLPYMMVPQSSSGLTVLWSPGGIVTVIASIPRKNGGEPAAYRLHIGAGGREILFVPLEPPAGPHGALSPDGTRALFWGEGGVVLYDYINWKVLDTLGSRPAFSCIWRGNDEVITGDDERIQRIRLTGSGPHYSLICIAQAAEFGFENGGNRILARSGAGWFVTDGTAPWAETGGPGLRSEPRPELQPEIRPELRPEIRAASLVSERYRVYLEKQSGGPYDNLPMVRNILSVGTVPLFPGIEYLRPPPSEQKDGPAGLFVHGLRGGMREVAVCFDLYDDAAGLPAVLDTLRRFGLRATFFLNGEFIRRYPGAAKDIAEAGHEAASMFFAPMDVSDARYRVDGDFISRGLARNEDEFNRAAGRELSLIWHPPYYAASPEIIAAAAAAGYKTVGRDTDPMDWLSREEAKRIGVFQFSASDMIDRIMDIKQPGSIIPIRLGLLEGGRADYLFNRLDVLLDALVRSGYSVVPVSAIIDHAR